MKDRNFLDAATVNISTISPLFIGTKSPNYGWGLWSIDRNEKYVYVIDPAKFNAYLDEQGLIDAYTSRFADPNSFANKKNWVESFLTDSGVLKNMNLNEKKEVAHKISSGIIYYPASTRGPFICSGKGQVFLPGSSIKGAFRTAFAYKVLKNLKKDNPKVFEARVEKVVMRKLKEFPKARNRNKFKETFDQEIIGAVLYPPDKTLANFDLFRFVKISDGTISDTRTQTGNAVVLTMGQKAIGLKKKQDGKPMNIPCEFLPSDTSIFFKITIDMDIYSNLKADLKKKGASIYRYLPDIHNTKDLLAWVKIFAEDQWDFEQKHTANWLKGTDFEQLFDYYDKTLTDNQSPFLRLGWGTGMMGMTVNMLFDGNSDGSGGLRERIRNMTTPRQGEPAPKSRRLLNHNGKLVPFGWVRLIPEQTHVSKDD